MLEVATKNGLKRFKDVFWLASWPRSGNTLFRMALRHYYGIGSLSVYQEGYKGFEFLRGLQPLAHEDTVAVKTHEAPMPGTNYPAILIVRDGREAIMSMAHYLMAYNPFCNSFDMAMYKANIEGYDTGKPDWSEFHEIWLKVPHIRVDFKDLVADPKIVVGNAVSSVLKRDLQLVTDSSMPTFSELHDKFPHFFRRGKSGIGGSDWSEGRLRTFWSCHGAMMKRLGCR